MASLGTGRTDRRISLAKTFCYRAMHYVLSDFCTRYNQRCYVTCSKRNTYRIGDTNDRCACLQVEKDQLEYDARLREGKAWLVDDEVYDQKMKDLGITDAAEMISMWGERTWYDMKMWFRQLIRDFFELLFNAAALTIDTLRTFFLVVLSILGPLAFALSVYDGFQSTLTNWISRYISVYLWLPISDLFSAVLSKIQALMLQMDIDLLRDPSYVPDASNGIYIIFFIIGIIGYFSIPSVAGWVIQAGGGSATRGVNTMASKGTAMAGGVAGAAAGNVAGRLMGKK